MKHLSIILVVMSCMFTAPVCAQEEKNDSVSNSDNPLTRLLSDMQTEVETLRDSIKNQQNTIAYLAQVQQDLIKHYKQQLKAKDDTLADNKATILKQQQQLAALARIDETVYRQCLLYPMVIRYDSTFIEESVHCLDMLGLWNHPKYKETCNVYRSLLYDYGKYNSEVLHFLKQQVVILEKKRWNINSIDAQGLTAELQSLEYYRFYKGRNKKPWKSIAYLDSVIERLEVLLAAPKNITEASYTEVINSLLPKK